MRILGPQISDFLCSLASRGSASFVAFVGVFLINLSFTHAGPYSFGGGACRSQGTWTENALSATRELKTVVEGLRNAEGCGQLAVTLDDYLKSLDSNLNSVEEFKTQTHQISNIQEEVLATRQYARHPDLGGISSKAMVSGINELAALSIGGSSSQTTGPEGAGSSEKTSSYLPNLGARVFKVGKTGIHIADKILDSLTAEEMKCLSSPNLMGPFFTAMVQLSASLVGSGQDFFGKDVSSLVNKITALARNTHFDRISRDLHWLQFQNSMSCLIDTLAEGYCTTLDAQVLFNEEMKRAKPISWAWDGGNGTTVWKEKGSSTNVDAETLKKSIFEGYYVLTQQLPIVTAFLERIQRGILPKNYSDAEFQNKIQSNTFGYFLNERNIVAEWNEARTTITQMSNLESQKSAIADTLKKLGRLIVGGSDHSGLNFLDRVTNMRKVIFQLMGREIPPEVVGKNGMQIGPENWLDVNFSHFIGDPGAAMAEISRNLDVLLAQANQAAVEYYNYWFIADQPGLMVDSLTGMTYNIPEALSGIKEYLEHFSRQDYVEGAVLPAVYETIEKINRILDQYEKLRVTGLELKKQYGDLNQYPLEQRKQILATAITQYKDLIEIFYNEFVILKARSSFLVNRLTSFVKIDYQKRLRSKNLNPAEDNELLRQIYYATGDLVFERMRLISSKNPAEIDSDLNLAQRTYLQSLRSLEDLVKDSFAAAISQMKMEVEGADTTTSGIFEDSIIRANRDSDANSFAHFQAWLSDRIYDGLPEAIKPSSKRAWEYRWADKVYGAARMFLNPDRYPGMYALNPVRIFTKKEAPGVQENANGAVEKSLALFCIQSLAFRDHGPFHRLCQGIILKSPIIDEQFRGENPDFPFLHFLDVNYDDILRAYYHAPKSAEITNGKPVPQLYPDLDTLPKEDRLRSAKNYDARVCALRQRNRNNYIMFLTQGKYLNRQ